MKQINKIRKKLFETCYLADKDIAGLSKVDSKLWAKANSIRHAHTIKAILDYSIKSKKMNLKILNASGIGSGHQDFSIVKYLRENLNINFRWTVYDSPGNPYLKKHLFKKLIKRWNIDLRLSDFRNLSNPYGNRKERYDIVIFTEIAEHLDHSVFLNTLKNIQKKLKKDGILIFTTPNLVSLINRIKILFGNGDYFYCMDSQKNYSLGLYGHITLYDIRRLRRLLHDSGIDIDNYYIYTYGYGPIEKSSIKRLGLKIIEIISSFIKDSKENIFIVAKRNH